MIIPNIWENKIDVPNHQPVMIANPKTTEIRSFVDDSWNPSHPHPVLETDDLGVSFFLDFNFFLFQSPFFLMVSYDIFQLSHRHQQQILFNHWFPRLSYGFPMFWANKNLSSPEFLRIFPVPGPCVVGAATPGTCKVVPPW